MAKLDRTLAKARFVNFLQGKKLRITTQRRAIIDSVFSTAEHFTAGQLLKWSRRRDKIGRAHV